MADEDSIELEQETTPAADETAAAFAPHFGGQAAGTPGAAGAGGQPGQPGVHLRKIKRPKLKLGEGSAQPISPKINIEDFDLDEYLDKPAGAAGTPSWVPPVSATPRPTMPERPQQPANLVPASGRNAGYGGGAYDGGGEPQFAEADEDAYAEEAAYGIAGQDYITKKVLIAAALLAFGIGFVFAKLFFSSHTVVRDGLQGVIANPEVPMGRARCGEAEKTQGCVLYIMNPQRQELNARDFYDLASQLTGRQKFIIETGNMRYANTRIAPGRFVQLNIPPL